MSLRIDLRQKLIAQMSRLVPTRATGQCADENSNALHQEVYESIALGNALADIEDEANRAWRGQ